MKTSTIIFIVVVVICAIASVIVVIGGLMYVGAKGISTRQPTDVEKKLVLNTSSLDEFGQTLDPKCAKYTWKRNLDATQEIEFEYDCEGAPLSITSGIEITRTAREARESFTLTIGAYKTGMAIGGGSLDVRPELLTLGDQRYSALIKKEQNVVGNVFVVRQGRVVHSLLITGIYFEDPDDIRDLLAPLLEESKKQF